MALIEYHLSPFGFVSIVNERAIYVLCLQNQIHLEGVLPMSYVVSRPQQDVADQTPTLEDLHSVYQAWLEAEWPDHPGQLNHHRASSALSNFQRALRALSYADGMDGELRGAPASLLLAEGQRIGALVEQGLLLEAVQKKKNAPKLQLIQNMQSIARSLAKFLKANGQREFQSGFHKLNKRTGRKRREALAYLDWPESLRRDLEEFQRWLGATLTSEESRYREKKLSDASIKSFRTRLGQYVKWRLEQRLPAAELVDLINERNFADYLDDYLRENPASCVNLGGYSAARMTGIALGGVVRYLVATERFDPIENRATPEAFRSRPSRSRTEQNQRFNEGEMLKKAFYRLGKQSFKDGAIKKRLIRNNKVKGWKPKDLRDLRNEGFYSRAQRTGNQSSSYIENFTRKRSATAFGLSAETPFRIRTLSLILWENMTRQPDGRWHVLVSGDQLKIKMSGDDINTYEMTYSKETSSYIDEYRSVLEEHFGP